MGKIISNEDVFPATDLPDVMVSRLVPPLQNRGMFNRMHGMSHDTSRLYSVGHTALAICARGVLGREPSRVEATLMGCSVFEAIGGVLSAEHYGDQRGLVVVSELSLLLGEPEGLMMLPIQLEQAANHLQAEAPTLAEAVSEIVTDGFDYDEAAVLHALQGAGMMRTMQLEANRMLAAV
jgi:hypothetical protein